MTILRGAALGGPSPVRRLLPWVGTESRRLALAVLLGSLAIGCGVGLLATSAWLISSAALKPQILELEVAIVAVRAFGIGRGVFRYGERLVSHDAAFRALSRLRLAVYDRLAVVAPAGVPAYRRGDLLERLVRDVDATQDLPLRVLVPYASGAVVALASVVLAFAILPAAGVVLAVSLLLAATVVPWITSRSAADAERATAPARGELNGDVLTLLDGVADLTMSGATKAWLDRLAADDLLIGRLAARRARAAGVAAGLGVLLSGGAVVAMLLVAIPAVRSGELVGVNLAVLVLLPLATYEAVVAMPTAALALGRVRGSAQRVVEVLDAVDPVPDPALPVDPPVGVVGVRISGLRAGWPGGQPVIDGLDLDVAAASRVGVVGSSGVGKSTLLAVLAGFLPYEGSVRLGDVELRDMRGHDVRHCRTCSTRRSSRTYVSPNRMPPTTRYVRHSTRSASAPGSTPHRSASTPKSVTTEPSCQPGSASASAWPACSSAVTPSCCSTSQPSTSTRRPPTSSPPNSYEPYAAEQSSG